MTNGLRQKTGLQQAPTSGAELGGHHGAFRAIEEVATVIRLKRGDTLDLGKDRAKLVFVVRSGYLILQADLSAGRRVAIALYSPGNIVRVGELPGLRTLTAIATSQCQILRLGEAAFDRLNEQSDEVRSYCARETSLQSARDKSHIVLLAGFSGEERVVSFFVEMAYRLGRRHGAVISVEIPFSRSDIANFIALNPDTLSRIFSRLKSLGLIRTSGRRSIEILELAGLSKLSVCQLGYSEIDFETIAVPLGLLTSEQQ